MITPKEKDIGRNVTYIPEYNGKEFGIITSFNDVNVFVRYGSDTYSKATRREDLRWG